MGNVSKCQRFCSSNGKSKGRFICVGINIDYVELFYVVIVCPLCKIRGFFSWDQLKIIITDNISRNMLSFRDIDVY